MVDEIFDRGYQAARGNLNANLAQSFAAISHTIGDSLRMLHHVEWAAPWAAPRRKRVRRA